MKLKTFLEFYDEDKENHNRIILSELMSTSLYMIAQTHMWHWLIKSGQKHTALEEFYTAINEEIDVFSEKLLSLGDIELKNKLFNLEVNTSNEYILSVVKSYRNSITKCISMIKNDSNLYSILDSLADLQEETDKFIYKFNLE